MNIYLHHDDAGDGGLQQDVQALTTMQARRRALRLLGGAGAAGVMFGSVAARAAGSCTVIAKETAGPYPGDGSNAVDGETVNVLQMSGIVRSDIRSSVDNPASIAAGVPTTVRLKLVNTNDSCRSLAGYAIYVWHCTADGLYSLYSPGATEETYLRGVQATDANGLLSFETIFPGCYTGRMPHIHLEIYPSLEQASLYTNKIRTTQLAFPRTFCKRVYANAAGYESSARNLSAISFATDGVFRDGYSTELLSLTENANQSVTAQLKIGIAV